MSKRGFKTTKSTQHVKTSKLEKPAAAFRPNSSWKLILPGLALFKRHIVSAAFIFIVPGLLATLAGRLISGHPFVDIRTAAGAILLVIVCVWLVMNIAANYYFQLRIIADNAGRPGIIESYRRSARYLPRIVALGVIVILTISIGLLLFIVPGFIALRRYFLSAYFLVDSDVGIREAMQQSAKATKPYRGYIWSMLLIMAALSATGAAAQRQWPSYGGVVATLLVATYVLLPALRYREVALHKSALAIKD